MHPYSTLGHAASPLFPVLWVSSVPLAQGNGQMALGASAEAVNPLEGTQALVTGLRSDLHKAPTALPS